nr:cytochrome c oxidase accessory protein CcoG [Brevundimonas sp.]
DIRDGAQLECINCGLCIDACDDIMVKVDRPKGLIAYDTDAAVAARARGETPKHRLIRPRTLYYGVALTLVSGLMIWGFVGRKALDVHALRDRNPPMVRLSDGAVRNGYTLKIANRGFQPTTVEVRFSGVEGARLHAPGRPAGEPLRIQVEPNRVTPVRVFVTVPYEQVGRGQTGAAFDIRAGDERQQVDTAFAFGEPR